jgi:hypothetical protein
MECVLYWRDLGTGSGVDFLWRNLPKLRMAVYREDWDVAYVLTPSHSTGARKGTALSMGVGRFFVRDSRGQSTAGDENQDATRH